MLDWLFGGITSAISTAVKAVSSAVKEAIAKQDKIHVPI